MKDSFAAFYILTPFDAVVNSIYKFFIVYKLTIFYAQKSKISSLNFVVALGTALPNLFYYRILFCVFPAQAAVVAAVVTVITQKLVEIHIGCIHFHNTACDI